MGNWPGGDANANNGRPRRNAEKEIYRGLVTGLFVLAALPAWGQETPPTPTAPAPATSAPAQPVPSVGPPTPSPSTVPPSGTPRSFDPKSPLPNFQLSWTSLEGSPSDKLIYSGAQLLWGDLYLKSDQLIYEPGYRRLQANGQALFRRGDETIRGESLAIDAVAGTLNVQNATLITPPFYIEGREVRSGPGTLIVTNARLALQPSGKSEFELRADEVRVVRADRIALENAKFYLYGKRFLTVRHVALPVSVSTAGEVTQTQAPPPVVLRYSRISGFVFGFGGVFRPLFDIPVGVAVDQSSLLGIQYAFSTQIPLVKPPRAVRSRRLTPAPFGLDPRLAVLSPLRRLITARPQPPAPDPVLDYASVLATANPLSLPTRAVTRSVDLTATYSGNQEFGFRRQGPLILSRLPQVTIEGELPFFGPVPPDSNEEARRFLRTPRFYLTGSAGIGRYSELRPRENAARTATERRSGSLGFATRPLLVGDNLLVLAQATRYENRYGLNAAHFGYDETTLAADYIFRRQTSLGASYIGRQTRGATPFLFDQLDARNEGQLRGQIALKDNRLILGAGARFDTKERKLFDLEIAVSTRRGVLEPRFTYRRLNSQFGFSIGIIGITTPP